MKTHVGVIGLGRMGRRHFEAYSRNKNIVVSACCDSDKNKLRAFSSIAKFKQGYVDWKLMLQREHLDLLSVVANGPSHAEITIAAAKMGIPKIICEKPMATSVKDAKRMIEATKNTRLAINYSRRWSHAYHKLRSLLRRDEIGSIRQIYCVCGGGQLGCNGSHFLDLMRFLSDSEPEKVIGFIDRKGTPNPRGNQFRDPGAFGLITFKNGMRGFIDMYEDLGIPPKIEIIGSIGRVTISESNLFWLIESRKGKSRKEPLGKYDLSLHPRLFRAEPLNPIQLLERTIEEILRDKPVSCTGEDGLAALEMVMGFHASSKGKPVPIPLASKWENLKVNFT